MWPGNPRGCWTLFARETQRFLKVKMQTIAAPALTAILYLLIFHYAMGRRAVPGLSVPYFDFLIPGLVMMSMLQNAFANTSSSIVIGKVMNVHIYLLMAPLSAFEAVGAFLAAAVMRALVVAVVLLAVLVPFATLSFSHIPLILFYGVCGSILMGGFGIIGGMWSKKFDDMAMITNFVIMPLTFLSGVFYSVKQLPLWWQHANHFNPFFYLIDGFRYGFIGVGDTNPYTALWVVGGSAILVMAVCCYLWHIGWRLKD